MFHKSLNSQSSRSFRILCGNMRNNFYDKKKSRIIHGHQSIKGSALVIAVFIIIVMSLLGATLVKILASSQQNVVYEVLGTRAYAAAQSGVQWQLSQVFPLNSAAAACASQTPPSFSNVNGLEQCSIAVSCSDFVIDSTRYYTITATGKCQAGDTVTSRTLQVDARSLP